MSGGVAHLVLSGPVLLAIPVAAAAGAITFLSPCCLPLVPGYLSYVTGMSGTAASATETATAAPATAEIAGPRSSPARPWRERAAEPEPVSRSPRSRPGRKPSQAGSCSARCCSSSGSRCCSRLEGMAVSSVGAR